MAAAERMPPHRRRTPAGAADAKVPAEGEAGASRSTAVEALAKGLRLLTLFDEQRPSWRVTDLRPLPACRCPPSTGS